jgi:hypothetical protein
MYLCLLMRSEKMKKLLFVLGFCFSICLITAQVKKESISGGIILVPAQKIAMPPGCGPSAGSIGCNASSTFNVSTGYVGNNPTAGDNGCNPCCYAGSDLDCDGLQDVSFSVENSEWYQYCNSTSAAITITVNVDEPGGGNSCNIQGAVWVGNGLNATTLDCGNSAYTQYGSSPGGAADGFDFSGISVPAGQCAYVMIDGYGGSTCSGVAISIVCPVLPVELIAFKGINTGLENKLTWSTLTEKHNDYFILEKSIDGLNFEAIGIIDGAGDSQKQVNYSFTDKFLKHTLNYYRLKQVDLSEAVSYSDIIVVDNSRLKDQQPIKYTNVLGQEVSPDYQGAKLIFYPDGTVIKEIGNF